MVSCTDRGCDMLLKYDTDKDGVYSMSEQLAAIGDWKSGLLANDEISWLTWAYYEGGVINDICPGCVHKEAETNWVFYVIMAGIIVAALYALMRMKK